MTRRWIRLPIALLAAIGLFVASPLSAEAEDTMGTEEEQQPEAVEEQVQVEVDQEAAERRKAMFEEARSALDATNAALKALDEGKTKEALDALALATGKLEILLARDPDLALAPVDVRYMTHDLYATVDQIRAARKRVEELLEDGKVQEARALLSGLASEYIISVRNIPLATYPDAIKAVTPLIDNGETEEAKLALRKVLATLVVTDRVISLPVVRARHMLGAAEKLIDKEDRSEEETEAIGVLLQDARDQLEMAEALGYGEEADFKKFRGQIAELEGRIAAQEPTKGTFERLRETLDDLQTSFFD
jgi:hypothetical protein